MYVLYIASRLYSCHVHSVPIPGLLLELKRDNTPAFGSETNIWEKSHKWIIFHLVLYFGSCVSVGKTLGSWSEGYKWKLKAQSPASTEKCCSPEPSARFGSPPAGGSNQSLLGAIKPGKTLIGPKLRTPHPDSQTAYFGWRPSVIAVFSPA